jgi:hypothetical protein
MKTRPDLLPAAFREAGELGVLRTWHTELPVRQAVARYVLAALGQRRSAHGLLGQIRCKLSAKTQGSYREDLAAMLACPMQERVGQAKAVTQAIEVLRTARSS